MTEKELIIESLKKRAALMNKYTDFCKTVDHRSISV